MKKVLALVAIAGLAGIANAQSATVRTTVNGAANANVAPGATVTINTTVSWDGAPQLGGIKGDIRVQGNVGSGSNFTCDFAAGALVLYGAFNGGSREGIDIAVTPAFFTGGFVVPPSGNNTGVKVGQYDLNLAGVAPGTYSVGWVGLAAAPNVRLFPSIGSPSFIEVQPTLIGATITVIPAPASLALVGLGGLVAGRRRR